MRLQLATRLVSALIAGGALAAWPASMWAQADVSTLQEDVFDPPVEKPRKKTHPPTIPSPRSHGADVKASIEISGYLDTDAVWVATPTVGGSVSDDVAGWSVGGRYLVDAVSAASVDIVSTASRKWSEYRHVGSGTVSFKAAEMGVALSGGVSREPDYLSVAGGGVISVELFDKNIAPSIGVSFGHDDIGRTGMPKAHWETMAKFSIQPAVTVVIGRSTIASLAFDTQFERGYLAKPYRYVPLFAAETAEQLKPGASVDQVNELHRFRIVDALPRVRDRYAVTARIGHRFDKATLRLDERIYRDSWGLLASTTETSFFLDLGRRFIAWPHLRVHGQRAVSFWQLGYSGNFDQNGVPQSFPEYRTGDRELGSLMTLTGGLGVRMRLSDEMRVPWSITLAVDAARTQFYDTLYIKERRSLFSALTLEAGFQ